jgi:hypothetical protein
MALVVKDRVKQTTTTTGTGSIVLNGNVDGFQTFAAALANGDTTYYGIFVPSTNAYEVGLGTWTESSATLARTTVLESSNSGSAVNLTAQAEVFITQPAEKAVFQDSNGDVDLGGNKILFGNLYSTTGDLPSASTYHGMFAHVHGTGKAYYAHAGNWIELVNEDTSGNVSMGGNLTVTGDLTVNGTTTTVNTTNTVVTDSLIELANGTTGSPSNDAGIVIERGDSNNAFIGYDESADKFTVGTGSFTGASTGNLTITTGTLVANVEGNVTGNLTGTASSATNADTVDSLHASSFLRSDANDTATGELTFNAKLDIANGVYLGWGGGSSRPSITGNKSSNLIQFYTGGAERLHIDNSGIDVTGNIVVSGTVDGRDVATDGTKLDGIESGATGDQSASEILTAIKTVDGSGSGLDADTLDGVQGSSYLRSDADDTFTGTLTLSGTLNASGQTVNASIVNGNSYVYTPNIYLNDTLYHTNDTNTYLNFQTDEIRMAVGGSQEVTITPTGVQLGDTGNGYFQPVTGDYGSIQIDGGAHGGYEGYNIGGRASLLHNNSTTTGISNDVNNHWLFSATHGGGANLYHNGTSKLNTISSGANIDGDLNAVDNIYLASSLIHEGDTDTKLEFGTNYINLIAGNSTSATLNSSGIFVNDGSVAEDYDALSGTTPTCNVDNGGMFSLTMTGNTTFTFSGASSGYIQGFVLQLTGNGSTVTWPNTVRWAGGTAPDAPANGETDILVFITRDGGTNWYGVLSSDAAA